MASFNINGQPVTVEADGDTLLLWVLREHLKLTGTKYGCGIGQCGACTVHNRRQRDVFLPDAAHRRRGPRGHDDRGAGRRRRPPAATRLGCRGSAAMRLLPVRADHARGGSAGQEPGPEPR